MAATLTPTQNLLGPLLVKRRAAKGKTQEEIAQAIGMARTNYSHIESGRRKEVLSDEQAIVIARELEIEMLDLVLAMGFPVRLPKGVENQEELDLLRAFRQASPVVRRFLLQGLGL